MSESARPKPAQVIGPFGPLTIADLPSPGPQRWSIRRKAEVIVAVRGGLLSLVEACSRYALDIEEYSCWEYRFERYGLAGLRTTRTQLYMPGGKAPRRQQYCGPNQKAKGRSANGDAAASAIRERPSNAEGNLFTVLRPGFPTSGSSDFCQHPSGGT